MFVTCSDILSQKTRRVQLFCQHLDATIGLLFRPGHVIEIAGEAGAGKTQWALQLSVCAAVSRNLSVTTSNKNDGIVVYIATEGEGPFPSTRLKEIVDASRIPPFQRSGIMDRIIVETVQEIDQLFVVLETRLKLLSKNYRINLVVLDSIAGVLRSESEGADRRAWSTLIHKLGYNLNMTARKLDTPIVVINQVSAFMDQAQESFGRSVVPCFGLAFSSYVHSRIFLERNDVIIKPNLQVIEKEVCRLRTASVDFSPLLPSLKVHYVVQASGVQGVNIHPEKKA